MFCRRSGPARWGHLILAQRGSRRARSELLWSGVERPCSAGIRSERVEALGGGRAYDLDACGRLGRRDERARQVLQSIPRSLVSAPAVHHSVSRWRRPAAGWAGRIDNPLRSRTNARENPGDCQHWKENERGSKLFRRKFTQALTASLVNGLQATWQVIQDALNHWTIADLAELVHDTDEHGEDQTYTRQWVIWHLIEHDLHHGGELSFTLGMHGLNGITI